MSDIDEKLSELREAVGISSDTEELYQKACRDAGRINGPGLA